MAHVRFTAVGLAARSREAAARRSPTEAPVPA